MNKKKDQPQADPELQQTIEAEAAAHDDAMAFLALRGAVKPDDLALWEIQELCQAFLRHLHRKRGE